VLTAIAVIAVVLAAAGAYFLVGGVVGVFAVLVAYALLNNDYSNGGICECDCECEGERECTDEERRAGLHLHDIAPRRSSEETPTRY
jgi:hypothetical protein